MSRDFERLRRLAEDFGDEDARRTLGRERVRRVYVRTDAILNVIRRVELQLERHDGPEVDFAPLRRHVQAGELADAARLARRIAYSLDAPAVASELRELVGVFGCIH